MNEEEFLIERCRIMLSDCIQEALEAGISHSSSLKDLNEFIGKFMQRHNLK
jgi:hypothetical protein